MVVSHDFVGRFVFVHYVQLVLKSLVARLLGLRSIVLRFNLRLSFNVVVFFCRVESKKAGEFTASDRLSRLLLGLVRPRRPIFGSSEASGAGLHD